MQRLEQMNFRSETYIRLRSVASTTIAVLLARFLSLALFALSARLLSQTENAGLIYVTGVSNLIVQIGTLGWLNLSRRMAARFDEVDPALAKGFLLRSFQIPTAVVAIICVLMILLSYTQWVDRGLSDSIFYTGIVSLPLLFNLILREYLAALNRPALSILSSETIPLGLTLALLFATGANDLRGAAFCVLTGSLFALILQVLITAKPFRTLLASATTIYDTRRWSRIAAYTLVGYGGKLLMDRMDSLLLAPIAGLDQLAFFNSAVRIANLMLLVPTILLPVFAPRISKAYMNNDVRQLRFEVFVQLALIGLSVGPLATALVLFPNEIIGFVFGDTYREAGNIMWLVVISQTLFAFSLPLSNLLMMTDGETAYAAASVGAVSVNFILGLLLISSYSITGAAIATAISTFILAAILTVSASKYLKLGILSRLGLG